MILKLWQKERRVDVWVAVVNLLMVRMGTACCPQWRHHMRTSIFTQGSQCRGVWAQIWTS